jgi:hypothetical protein
MMKMPPPVANRSLRSCEEMRPQAGVGKLKHAPPMHATDLPVVAQAVSPANRILNPERLTPRGHFRERTHAK